ncbi:MAG: hypothetical protein ACKPAF_00850, partial [Actinomycetota bacterium]
FGIVVEVVIVVEVLVVAGAENLDSQYCNFDDNHECCRIDGFEHCDNNGGFERHAVKFGCGDARYLSGFVL